MAGPDIAFWEEKFARDQTPWDRGQPSPKLRDWLAAGELSPLLGNGQIGVPGCGSGHEVELLAAQGHSVIALDYAPTAVALTRARLAAQGLHAEVIQADVLAWQAPQPLAAIYEQTCLCALHPDHWQAYAKQLHSWLRPGGRLFALFMQWQREGAARGLIEGPPYHCDINAMRALFPADRWSWPKPPYERVPHPMGAGELALVLIRL